MDKFLIKQRVQLWNSLERVVRECRNTSLALTGRPQIRTEVDDHLSNEDEMVAIEPDLPTRWLTISERFTSVAEKEPLLIFSPSFYSPCHA